ncbi:MAG: ribulose-phosphate 3-epimerase [Deltaproteobacteria bacterium]|nr:MAG: ribulose-phosphate 3-epimerase [Deltaproteobacteria bacterium]
MSVKKIAPSILSADFSKLSQEIQEVEKAGADYLHIDVMDGQFVPNITVGPLIVRACRKVTRLPLDVHLMIQEPDRFIEEFAREGSDIITVHQEACPHLHRTITRIKELGKKAGVSLNPATSLSTLDQILPEVDLVLVMTVNPGFGGQQFIRSILPKIAQLRELLDKKGLTAELEVDGGVNVDNIAEVAKAGGQVFVAGNAVFKSEDYRKTISELRRKAEQTN